MEQVLAKALAALLSQTGLVGLLLLISLYVNFWLLRKLLAYTERDRIKSETWSRKYHELASELKGLTEDLVKKLGNGER